MSKKLIVITITLLINAVITLKAETIKGLTKEQQKEINKIIDKRVEQRLERLRQCLRNRENMSSTAKLSGSRLSDSLNYCIDRSKLNK